MLPLNIKGTLVICSVLMVIIVLWYLVGALMPLYLNSLEHSALFGDSFGSVNSLFSGIGIVGITYTLYLQVQAGIEQKRKDEFQLYLKLIDDIRNDLNSLRYNTLEGINVIKFITDDLHLRNGLRLKENNANHILNFIANVVIQFEFMVKYVNSFRGDNFNQRELLIAKTANVYFSYLMEFVMVVRTSESIDHEMYSGVRQYLLKLDDAIRQLVKDAPLPNN